MLRHGDLEVVESLISESGPLDTTFCNNIMGLDAISIQTRIPQVVYIRMLSKANLSVTGINAYEP